MIKICVTCGKEYKVFPSQEKRYSSGACSYECRPHSYSTCAWCGDDIDVTISLGKRYCSDSCREQFAWERLTKSFLSRVNKVNDCWVWVGPISYGKNKFPIPSSKNPLSLSTRAQVASWILFKNSNYKSRKKRWITNTCNNHLCVNPDHLIIKSAKQVCVEREKRKQNERIQGNNSVQGR